MYGELGAKEEVDRIFASVDTDKSGEIDFSEFVAATVNKSNLLHDDKLRAAFKNFDKDGCGHLHIGDIK